MTLTCLPIVVVLVPESIGGADATELIDEDAAEERTRIQSRLQQSGRPQVHVIRIVAVQVEQLLDYLHRSQLDQTCRL